MKQLALGLVLLLTLSSHSMTLFDSVSYPIEVTNDWHIVSDTDGILIEYKVQECNNLHVKNQVLVLFRYTNTSTEIKTMTWATKEFRNGVCVNCDRLESSEMVHSLTLSPGEVLEGDGTSKMDKRVYLFSHFIDLVPGMSEQRLTNFELVNVVINTIQTNSND